VPNLKRLTFLAVFFLVILRLAIGWQMFYEGLWKYERIGTAEQWSAAGYLKNAQGPLRDRYRNLVEDPDDLNWLDDKWVSDRWDAWKKNFAEHYGLNDEQKVDFEELVEGPAEIPSGPRTAMTELPKDKLIGGSLEREKTIFAKKNSRGKYILVVDGKQHLTPGDYSRLKRDAQKKQDRYGELAKSAPNGAAKSAAAKQVVLLKAFQRTLDDVYKRQSRLAFRERLKVLLQQDPERVSLLRDDQKGTVDYKREGKIEEYKKRLTRYNETAAEAKIDYQKDHLRKEWQRIRELHAELVGPVQQLEKDMQIAARKILTEEQYDKGRVAMAPPGRIDQINQATMWSLMVIGMLLIVGFFSRLSALAGGLLILSFYLANPPLPGIPQPGPAHSLIVNKNLIEVLALFALTFIPTGKFFGVDAFFIGLFRGWQSDPKKGSKIPASSMTLASNKKSSGKPSGVSPAEKVVQAKSVATSPPPPPVAPVASTPPPLNPGDTYTIQPPERNR
jgi:uncharacterized membrane protein YphA (DoxX/SURF4 family)